MAGFTVVENEQVAAPDQNAVARQMLSIALGALSNRALAGISALFSIISLASVWVLWYTALPAPNILQLIGIGMYSLFILALEIIRRK